MRAPISSISLVLAVSVLSGRASEERGVSSKNLASLRADTPSEWLWTACSKCHGTAARYRVERLLEMRGIRNRPSRPCKSQTAAL